MEHNNNVQAERRFRDKASREIGELFKMLTEVVDKDDSDRRTRKGHGSSEKTTDGAATAAKAEKEAKKNMMRMKKKHFVGWKVLFERVLPLCVGRDEKAMKDLISELKERPYGKKNMSRREFLSRIFDDMYLQPFRLSVKTADELERAAELNFSFTNVINTVSRRRRWGQMEARFSAEVSDKLLGGGFGGKENELPEISNSQNPAPLAAPFKYSAPPAFQGTRIRL